MKEKYETPTVTTLGSFRELTAWYGWASNDGEGVAII